MGRLIQCCSPLAKRPYHFHLGNVSVYSIEEVCYFISKNIYLIQKKHFGKSFVEWVRDELQMEETAEKLTRIWQSEESTLQDIVVTVCCSCDYFDEPQIHELLHIMDEIEHLPERERQKIKLDTELQSGHYERAVEGYQAILRSESMMDASPAEYAPIYHNVGVAYGQLGEYEQAATFFLLAFETNKKDESLRSYVTALYLSGAEDPWKEMREHLDVSEDKMKKMKEDFEACRKKCSIAVKVRQIKKMRFPAGNGKLQDYYPRIEEMMKQWKEEYRTGIL